MRTALPSSVRLLVLAIVVATSTACATAAVEPFDVASAQTAAQVITALVNDPEIGARPIEVEVTRGAVRLSGRVRTVAERDRAIEIARRVPGVTSVDAVMRIGADPPPHEPPPRSDRRREVVDPAVEFSELEEHRDRFAAGLAFGSSRPGDATLASGRALGPLLRFGTGAGLGPTLGFDWFRTTFAASGPDAPSSGLRVRPVMAGLAYTVVVGRVSVAPSLVAGYAVNSIDAPDSGPPGRVAIDVDNSWVWRPGVSVWLDTSPRTALNLSMGRLMTRLDLTVVEDGQIGRRTVDSHATMVSVGLVYKLF